MLDIQTKAGRLFYAVKEKEDVKTLTAYLTPKSLSQRHNVKDGLFIDVYTMKKGWLGATEEILVTHNNVKCLQTQILAHEPNDYLYVAGCVQNNPYEFKYLSTEQKWELYQVVGELMVVSIAKNLSMSVTHAVSFIGEELCT